MLMKAQSGTLTGVPLFFASTGGLMQLAEPASDTQVQQAVSETAQGVWRTERE